MPRRIKTAPQIAVNDHPYTQDDIIYKNGRYYENENSEDWEEFEYAISDDERVKK